MDQTSQKREKSSEYMKNSRALYVIKFFAILTVIFAHCSYHNTPMAHAISGVIGGLGVPIFLITSGMFFNPKEPTKTFWMKKVKGVIVPWLVFGCFTYALAVILGNPLGILEMLKWIIGYGTWLYFVPILLFFYAFFRAIRWKGIHYVAIALWILSNVLDVFGINPISNIIGNYLNVFSRIGYFSMGVIARNAGAMELKEPKLWIKLAASLVALCLAATAILTEDIAFASYVAEMLFTLVASVVLFFWSQSLSRCNLLSNVGKQTYLIYFVHMQLGIGVVNAVIGVFSLPSVADWALLVIKPVLILALVYTGILILDWIIKKVKIDKYKWIIGMR